MTKFLQQLEDFKTQFASELETKDIKQLFNNLLIYSWKPQPEQGRQILQLMKAVNQSELERSQKMLLLQIQLLISADMRESDQERLKIKTTTSHKLLPDFALSPKTAVKQFTETKQLLTIHENHTAEAQMSEFSPLSQSFSSEEHEIIQQQNIIIDEQRQQIIALKQRLENGFDESLVKLFGGKVISDSQVEQDLSQLSREQLLDYCMSLQLYAKVAKELRRAVLNLE